MIYISIVECMYTIRRRGFKGFVILYVLMCAWIVSSVAWRLLPGAVAYKVLKISETQSLSISAIEIITVRPQHTQRKRRVSL